MMHVDGLSNALAGLGGPADRQATTTYLPWQGTTQSAQAAWAAAYDSASVAQKIVDIPALDATREWRVWQLKPAQKARVEALEARLNLRAMVLVAYRSARLFGGASLYATDGQDPAKPLKGPIQGFRVLSRSMLRCGQDWETDLSNPAYGQPRWFELQDRGTTGDGRALRLHPSRLAIFHGIRRPPGGQRVGLGQEDDFWGLSVLAPVMAPLKALDGALHNAAALFHKAVVDTVRIPGLSGELQQAEGEAAVRKRLETLKYGMSVHNLAALDGEESLERPALTFAGQDKMMREFAQMVCAAADIPMTRLFGRSPGGLSATGDSDMRNYYDHIREIQTADLAPALGVFDTHLMDQAGVDWDQGGLPYTWAPLWQEPMGAKAQVALDMSQALKTGVEASLIDPNLARQSLETTLKDLGLMARAHVKSDGGT